MKHLVIPKIGEEKNWGFPDGHVFILCTNGEKLQTKKCDDLDSIPPTTDLVVFAKAGPQPKCISLLAPMLGQGDWCVWIHTGHPQRPTDEQWKLYFDHDDRKPFQFLMDGKHRVEWYSVEGGGSSQVHAKISSVRNSVEKAVREKSVWVWPDK